MITVVKIIPPPIRLLAGGISFKKKKARRIPKMG
tara:strand:- start:47 stop:148 length:102 start_codon:yes stop_codon:yes gene_type:complete